MNFSPAEACAGAKQALQRSIAVTPDALIIIVPLRDEVRDRKTEPTRPARYPTVNHQVRGAASYGRKTVDYEALFADVADAGREAVRLGWQTIVYPCRTRIYRFVTDHLVRDALNLGGCEANALTASGVWSDDSVGRPIELDILVDPAGPDRVFIEIVRIPPPPGIAPRAPRPKIAKRSRGRRRAALTGGEPSHDVARLPMIAAAGVPEAPVAGTSSRQPPPEGVPLLNGVPISLEDAKELLFREFGDHERRRR